MISRWGLPECTIMCTDPNAETNGLFVVKAERWDYVLIQGLVHLFCLVSDCWIRRLALIGVLLSVKQGCDQLPSGGCMGLMKVINRAMTLVCLLGTGDQGVQRKSSHLCELHIG